MPVKGDYIESIKNRMLKGYSKKIRIKKKLDEVYIMTHNNVPSFSI